MPPDQLANDPAARTSEGAIIDQKGTPLTTETVDPAKTETPTIDPKVETPTIEAKDGTTLLTGKDGEGEKKDGEAKPTVPEKYEPFKVPEGFTLNEEVAIEAGTIFKELGLSQDQAQKLIDFHTSKTREAAEAPGKLWADTQKEWTDKVIKDPALGDGKSGLKPEVKATIAAAIDFLGPTLAPKFRQAVDFTGAGNNPDIVAGFYALGKLVKEGSHVSGGGPSKFGQSAPDAKPASIAAAMFPNLPTGR